MNVNQPRKCTVKELLAQRTVIELKSPIAAAQTSQRLSRAVRLAPSVPTPRLLARPPAF